MNCIVRLAEERDIDALAKLDSLCFTLAWSRSSFEFEIKENLKAIYLVADYKGKIIGYGGIWIILDEGHITNIAVHPDFRNMGIGAKLLTDLIELSERRGANKQTLEVRVSNYPAISLYNKLGFKTAGKREKYYEDNGEDALILWRS
ncbi:MAG: ribosomal protein S18-alanine N-acetyltransferase [Clostridiales bacterium]|jgi:ribosomal-protein-alanine N-acetyltransferase|nr:ribosomal protein S18-alanine N-acetyltransferase [Clostridiales bacterium]